jgi:hypothetical protein
VPASVHLTKPLEYVLPGVVHGADRSDAGLDDPGLLLERHRGAVDREEPRRAVEQAQRPRGHSAKVQRHGLLAPHELRQVAQVAPSPAPWRRPWPTWKCRVHFEGGTIVSLRFGA